MVHMESLDCTSDRLEQLWLLSCFANFLCAPALDSAQLARDYWNPTRVRKHKRLLRVIEAMKAKFPFQKSVLGTLPSALEESLKSAAIPVCLSES